MALNVKYRPKILDEVSGNEPIVSALRAALENKEGMSHTYLFTGRPGCGKTTFAFVLKEHLEVIKGDFLIYDTANTRGIDFIRDIVDGLKNAPMYGKRKLYLLDECHQITPEGLNALLRTLEYGCPEHCFIVLCTAEFDSIRKTLKEALVRRCRHYEVKPLNTREMGELLNRVLKAEGFGDDYPETITDKIISLSEGSPGHALSMLDSVINMTDEDEILEAISYAAYGSKEVFDICRILSHPTEFNKWNRIREIIPNIKKNDVEGLRYGMLNWLEKVLLNKGESDIAEIMILLTETFMYTGRAGLTLACYLACRKIETSWAPTSDIKKGKQTTEDDDIPF